MSTDSLRTRIAYEAARSLAPEWELHRDHLSAALSTLIRSGQQTTDTAYAAAQSLATLGRAWADACLNDVDVLLVPSAPGAAPAGLAATGDPIFNRVWTLLGLPCTNVPGLQGHNGLPIGVQLVGRMRGERPLLEASAAMHRALNAHRLNS